MSEAMIAKSVRFARDVRQSVLQMVAKAKASHVGSSLSVVDILSVLYCSVLTVDPKKPTDRNRDRVILSKGHAAAALYATLGNAGFFDPALLDTYCSNGGTLFGHATHHGVPGVEVSTGSLGHGLPMGIGIALGAKREKHPFHTFVILSDGECDEGSNWEGFLFAPAHSLSNLTVIIDYNKIQSFGRTAAVLDLEPLADKLRAFRWDVIEVDGHDHAALTETLARTKNQHRSPTAVIAHTVKGKGVSYMEDDLVWHYKYPNPEQLEKAIDHLRDDDA
jgi:transketolase